MTRQIWKFPIDPHNLDITMPIGAKLLTAREQGETSICVWAEINADADTEVRRFAIYGTGHEMPDDPGVYVGTAMLASGRLVFHVYAE